MQKKKFALLLIGVLFIAACGQSGPLYLPEEPPEPLEQPDAPLPSEGG